MPATFIPVGSQKLNTGAEIPTVGLGTWQSPPGEVAKAVEVALKSGYKLIDAAWIYGNEEEVGQGIKASGVKREDFFLTSKLWSTYHSRVEENLDLTLKALEVDYLDLYLVHWPAALNPKGNDPKLPSTPDGKRDIDWNWNLSDTWKQMEAVLATGKVKAIGVSNVSQPFLEDLLKTAKTIPAVNQVELHVYLPQDNLVKYMQEKGIVVQAYSPLGSTNSPLLKDPVVKEIADKHEVGVGTVLLSFLTERNIPVLAKSVTPKRIEENLKLIKLDAKDVETLGALHEKTPMRFVKPAWGVDYKFDTW